MANDPTPYVYGTVGTTGAVGFLMRYSKEIAREIPHIAHVVEHFPGPSIGAAVGFGGPALAGASLGWCWFLGGVGLLVGLWIQEHGD